MNLLLVEGFAVGLASFAGVSIRVSLSEYFSRLDWSIQSFTDDSSFAALQIFYYQRFLVANMLGCFIMGFCFINKSFICEYSNIFYVFLTTGLCGCITTFSSWINSSLHHYMAKNFYIVFSIIFVEFLLTWAAFALGIAGAAFLNELSRKNSSSISTSTATIPDLIIHENDFNSLNLSSTVRPSNLISMFWQYYHVWLITLFSIVFMVVWLVIFTASESNFYQNNKNQTTMVRSVALAPFGAILRWYLNQIPMLKLRFPSLYLPTLLANTLAVIIAVSLQVSLHNDLWAISILDGTSLPPLNEHIPYIIIVIIGFCGSLSTVSTLFVELRTLYIDQGPLASMRYSKVCVN